MPVAITRNEHAVMQAAEGDGRVVYRLGQRSLLNFFLEEDYLTAKVNDEQAAILAGIYGFEVEGYPVKEDDYQPKAEDFQAQGDRLYQEREFGRQEKEKQGTLAEQLVALLGADRVAQMFAEAMKQSVPETAVVAETAVAEKAVSAAKAEKTRNWVLKDVMKLKEDDIKDLLEEFASDLDSGPMHRSAAASALVKRANINPALDNRLRKLTGR